MPKLEKEPRVVVVLVNWNGWQDTVECLHSLQNQGYSNMMPLVVDNNSSNSSVEEIQKRFPGTRIHQNSSNEGFAGGNNAGIRIALEQGADYVWVLNNDCTAAPDALGELVKRMQEDRSIGICGSTLVYYDQRDTIQAWGGGTYSRWLGTTRNLGDGKPVTLETGRDRIEEELDYVAGASMMVSREFLEKTGLMCEEYFLYYEEIDWAERAGDRFNLGYAPRSVVYHKEGASIQAGRGQHGKRSRMSDYYQIRNRLAFTRKYYPYCLPSVYGTVLAALVNRMIRGEWDRIPMILGILLGIPAGRRES